LNIDESENFSDFEISNKFMLSFYKKVEVAVCETLNSTISVQNSFIVLNRV